MLFSTYAKFLERIELESGRVEITKIVAELLGQLKQEEITAAVYMLQARVVADYLPLELNFSDSSLLAALNKHAVKTGVDFDAKEAFGRLGDSGAVAQEYWDRLHLSQLVQGSIFDQLMVNPLDQSEPSPSAPEGLDVLSVHTSLLRIARSQGKGANLSRQQIAIDLLSNASQSAVKYLAKIITGKLRLGLSSKTILDAISWAKTGDKSLRAQLDRAYGIRADIGELAKLVLFETEDWRDLKLEPGTPLAAQLVEREVDASACLERIPEAIVQPKYDGLRAQLHYSKKGFEVTEGEIDPSAQIRVFSRNMEPLTDMFPDLQEAFAKLDWIDTLVLDGEIIGVDESTATFLPFQETIQRKRKYNVAETAGSIPIKYFVFDLLYLNGQDLTEEPLSARLEKLREINIDGWQGKISLTSSPTFIDPSELDKYFRGLLDQGLEGVIVKDPNSKYSPGKRGFDWIKLKANTFADLKDSVDCVVMGYYFGRGQRAKFGIGGFLVGIYNSESDMYETIAKVGSGVKENEWGEFKSILDGFKNDQAPKQYAVTKEMAPDVWVQPEVVIEVDADEITISKFHTAGRELLSRSRSMTNSGYSLRFPRLKKFGRSKKPSDTTTVLEIQRLYELGRK